MKSLVAIISLSVALSIACSASRSATSPAQLTATPATGQTSAPATNSIVQDRPICSLKMSEAPGVKGVQLGMTANDVLALFPGSKEDSALQAELSKPPGRFGNASFLIRPEKYENKTDFAGVGQLTITLLDGRVSSFTTGYKGPEWPHVDKFIAKFTEGTNLPAADQWEPYAGLEHQMKTLMCADFSIRVFAGGDGGTLNYVLMQDLEADKKLKERRKKAREQPSPTPGQ